MNCEVKGCQSKATITIRVIKRSVSYGIIPSASGKTFQLCDVHGASIEASIMSAITSK